MKIIFQIFIILFTINTFCYSSIVKQLEKLSILQEQGKISNDEFEKAKDIFLKMEKNIKKKKQNQKKAKVKTNKIIIRPFTQQVEGSTEFEKMEMIIGEYRIYTHRPGGIKIKKISNGKQLAVYGDKMKLKFYNDGEKYFQTEKVNENRLLIKFNDIPILLTDTRYVSKHQAHFYQILALGTKPFHYYIKLPSKAPIALNYKKFEKKIAKAVEEAKVKLASVHSVTIDQINLLMKRREEKAFAEIQNIIGDKKKEILEAAIDDSVDQLLSEQLEAALGAALASEFVSAIEAQTGRAIDRAIEDELAAALDEVIAAAISEGISEAAIQAGISAYLAAIAAGASEADAYAAGEEACGC